MKTLDITLTALNGALYAAVGYVLYAVFPFLCPTVGVVRFWPVVVIPATFAVLFGPLVGGAGAAIGIFISDMLIHGDPLLSLSVGVTSNFTGFALIGYLSRKNLDWRKTFLGLGIGVFVLATVGYLILTPEAVAGYFSTPQSQMSVEEALWNLFFVLGIFVVSYAIVIAVGYFKSKWRSFGVASVIGLVVGSGIIGIGVWAYTQIFTLPAVIGGAHNLPFYAGLILFAWTFATEIPFLVIMVPPIAEACYSAFPSLKVQKKSKPDENR
ncbi:MAG: hypothetical protein QXI91_05405 [Candidatus Bathyarchaeia archaeon]